MSIVKTKNLIYEYLRRDEDGNVEGVNRAVDDVSLGVRRGEFIAIVGHNGSGKSTLAKHMNAILQPTRGTVWVDGIDTSQEDQVWAVRQRAGMVFQNPDDQLFMPTVGEDVAFGPLNMKLPASEVERRVAAALAAVGATELRDRAPWQLSGGQKRSAAIATVLSMEPSILVLDEPSSNLDWDARRRLIDILNSFSHTILLATHDLDLAREVCPRSLVVDDGRIIADNATDIILSDPYILQRLGITAPSVTT